jgi:DNA replication protein DnaC
VDITSIKKMTHDLRLLGLHQTIEKRAKEAANDSLHPLEFAALLFEDEKLWRRQQVAKRLANRAKFRHESQMENWHPSEERGLNRNQLKELLTLDFVKNRRKLHILGKTGCGKTQLAIALGNRLCQQGISVRFFSSNLLFEELLAQKNSGTYLKFLRALRKVDVIILDDFALRSLTHDEAIQLLDILEDRVTNGSMILTSQVNPQGWGDLIEDQVIREALIDRLTKPADQIHLKGPSWRDRDTKEVANENVKN